MGWILIHIFPQRSVTEPWTLKDFPRTYYSKYSVTLKRKEKTTYSHRSNSALDVVAERMSAAPSSVVLNNISVAPFHKSQGGVISDESHFEVVLRLITKLRNECEKEFVNIVISFKFLTLCRLWIHIVSAEEKRKVTRVPTAHLTNKVAYEHHSVNPK